MNQLPHQQFSQPALAIDALGQAANQDLQNRTSAMNRTAINSQLNNSALGATGNNPGLLNNTAPLSAVAINQTALNNSTLNAQNALNNSALNRSNLNRSNLSNQPVRQVINTSVHNRSVYSNNLNNPIAQQTVIPEIPLNPHFDLNPQTTAAHKQQSIKLWVVFWTGALLVIIEMFMMLGRYHFLGLMAALAVIAMFVLNLFSNSYNRLILVTMLVSVGFDITWLVFKTRGVQYPSFYSPFATLDRVVNIIVIILLFISIIARLIIFGLMWSFWNVEPERAFFIVVFNNEIDLNGGPVLPMGYGSINYRPV